MAVADIWVLPDSTTVLAAGTVNATDGGAFATKEFVAEVVANPLLSVAMAYTVLEPNTAL